MLKIEKRNKEHVAFNPKKIHDRIKKAAKGLKVNTDEIFIKLITSIPMEGILTTKEIDKLVSEISFSYSSSHYDYSKLAANIAISSFNKDITDGFYETMKKLEQSNIINKKLIEIIESYGIKKVEKELNFDNDIIFDYFGWKSLQETYLLKDSEGSIVEKPQYMYMRIALWVTKTFDEAIEYYELLSKQLVSCATPIMINSGTLNPQLASCVLHYNDSDSREGLLNTLKDISIYSSDAAGIGLCLSNVRSKESKIKTSGGNAGGLLKYIKIINESLRFFNQQGRRPGAAAIYIEPWHKDIFDILDIRKNNGKEELRARDVFTALWLPDNFLRAVENNDDYYLFCPNDIVKSGLKSLDTIFGEEFEKEYNKAIELNLGKKIKAQDIWKSIYESQIETGTPYLASKDNVNKKSNHSNIGTIKQSNLCIEIMEYTDEKTTAICTLSSQVLKNFIKNGVFDFKLLGETTRKTVKVLNNVIDINHYSTKKGKIGGLSQRAIGIGIQGLADVFLILDLIFTSDEAKLLNKQIFETIYYNALLESMELCKSKEYKSYDYFEGSPISKGEFQFNLWGLKDEDLSGMYDWGKLRKDIIKNGVCNSLVTALMPVAGSAKITNSYEKDEVISSNLFVRSVLGGEFLIVNKYLIEDLENLGIWSDKIKNELIINNGSIQNINFNKYLDPELKGYDKKVKRVEFLLQKYRTIYETKQKDLIDMAADRGPFIDQSQSMNIHMSEPTLSKLTSSTIYGWKRGLKTLSYYTRTKAISTGAKHLAIDIGKNDEISEKLPEKPVNSPFDCFGCSA